MVGAGFGTMLVDVGSSVAVSCGAAVGLGVGLGGVVMVADAVSVPVGGAEDPPAGLTAASSDVAPFKGEGVGSVTAGRMPAANPATWLRVGSQATKTNTTQASTNSGSSHQALIRGSRMDAGATPSGALGGRVVIGCPQAWQKRACGVSCCVPQRGQNIVGSGIVSSVPLRSGWPVNVFISTSLHCFSTALACSCRTNHSTANAPINSAALTQIES